MILGDSRASQHHMVEKARIVTLVVDRIVVGVASPDRVIQNVTAGEGRVDR